MLKLLLTIFRDRFVPLFYIYLVCRDYAAAQWAFGKGQWEKERDEMLLLLFTRVRSRGTLLV